MRAQSTREHRHQVIEIESVARVMRRLRWIGGLERRTAALHQHSELELPPLGPGRRCIPYREPAILQNYVLRSDLKAHALDNHTERKFYERHRRKTGSF